MKFIAAFLFLLFAVGLYANKDAQITTQPRPQGAQEAHVANPNQQPVETRERDTSRDSAVVLSRITLTLKSWELGGFGTVMLADFNIKNDNAFAVKDLAVKCTHTAASGTEIDSNRRDIFQSFPSGKLVKINKFNMGSIHSQVASSSCRVTGFSFG